VDHDFQRDKDLLLEMNAVIHKARHHITKSLLRHPLNWFQHRGFGPADVFVASYPKSGTTWLRFLIYQLITGQAGNFELVNGAIPGVGRHGSAPRLLRDAGRLIQTHEPHRPAYGKAIYIVRDGRDVVISEYFYHIMLQYWHPQRPFDAFFDRFIAGRVNRYGDWKTHVTSWLRASEDAANEIHFVKYEALKTCPRETLAGVAHFLGYQVDEEQIRQALADNALEKMRLKDRQARRNVHRHHSEGVGFVRQGKAGGWRAFLTEDQKNAFERYAGNVLQRLGYL
jgi:hypothetical protein